MAAAAYIFDQTDVFAPKAQYPISSAVRYQETDAFARRERHITSVSDCRRPQTKINIALDGETVSLTYNDSDLPKWARPVLSSLPERWGIESGWDGHRAVPTNLNLVVRLLNVLSSVMDEHFSPPQVTPLSDGGMQAEWHACGRDLEIVVSADASPSYYFFDQAAQVEEEAAVERREESVRALIANFNQ